MSGEFCRKELELALSSPAKKRLDITITQTIELKAAFNMARVEQNHVDNHMK